MNLNRIIKRKQAKTSKNKQKTNKKQTENKTNVIMQMCKKSIKSGVCPHDCEICAWNILRYAGGEE